MSVIPKTSDQVDQWRSVMFLYDSALKKLNTKIEILNNEFVNRYDHNPIEHIKSRLKTADSIVKKLKKDGCEVTIDNMMNHLSDIAGIRIICSFVDDIYKVADMLTNQDDIKILSIDFEDAVSTAKKGDFIYFDPPYDSDTSTFNSYTEDGFGKGEQRRLAKVFRELSDRGCFVMLSNHNTKLINELYGDFNIHVIEAKRNINANGKKRGKVEEVIITNFENKRGFDNLI